MTNWSDPKPTVKIIAVFFLFLLISASTFVLRPSTASSYTTNENAIKNAENFLVNQYNSTLGLVSEYPGSSTYWLYSDNFLASYVLETVNPNNSTLTNIGRNVSDTLDRYMSQIPDPLNQYMILNSTTFPFYAEENYNITRISGSSIKITLYNGTSRLSAMDYADVAFLEALYYHKLGNSSEADSLFMAGASMYNGIGLNDSAFSGTYQTYKLALYVYTARLLGENYPPSSLSTLLRMQAANGGFYTGYNSNFSTMNTQTNVETSALSILAIASTNTLNSTKGVSFLTILEIIGILGLALLVSLFFVKRWNGN